MLRPPDNRLRVLAAAPDGPAPAQLAAALKARPGGELLKAHARGAVWRTTLAGHHCVLKCTPLAGPRRRLQALFRATPAWRHWRSARWLLANGVRTAAPLAIVRGRAGGQPVECLVLKFIPGHTVLHHLATGDLSPRQQHRVAEAVADLAVTLARRGRANRDPKPSNLIVLGPSDASTELAVIDCADLRPAGRSPIARALAAAFLEPLGCAYPPRASLRMRAVVAASRAVAPENPRPFSRTLWREAAAIVAAHGDPTPLDDPFQSSLTPPPHAP